MLVYSRLHFRQTIVSSKLAGDGFAVDLLAFFSMFPHKIEPLFGLKTQQLPDILGVAKLIWFLNHRLVLRLQPESLSFATLDRLPSLLVAMLFTAMGSCYKAKREHMVLHWINGGIVSPRTVLPDSLSSALPEALLGR